jgi:NADH-quinone oxidoreductase subunit M
LAYLLLLATLIPLVGALLSLTWNDRRSTLLISSISTASSGLLLLLSAVIYGVLGGSGTYREDYSWQPLGNLGFQLDGLSLTFALIVATVSFLTVIFSSFYMGRSFQKSGSQRWSIFFFLYQTFVFGMTGTALATNLVEFYIFFELMLIPSYFLIAEFGHLNRESASFSYFLWTHVGALIMLAGLVGLALSYGTLDISTIFKESHGLISAPSTPSNGILLFSSIAIVIGLMVKLGGFGLHVWLPGAYREAPAPVSVLLSSAMSGIAGYAMIRLVVLSAPSAFQSIAPWLLLWGLVSLAYGALMALVQNDFKLLLSYSSISQMGYLSIGIGSFSAFGIAGSVSIYAANGFAKSALFMTSGLLSGDPDQGSMSRMGGLAGRMPVASSFAVIGFLTMIGVPPTIGFISEFFIFQGAFASSLSPGSTLPIIVPLVVVIASVLTSGYSLLAIKRIFFGKPSEFSSTLNEAPTSALLPMGLLCALSILLGILPILYSSSFSFISSSLQAAWLLANTGVS